MTTPAQTAARRAFGNERKRIAAADRALHVAPPKSVDVLVGLWQCHGCGALRWGGDRQSLPAPPGGPFGVLFYDPGCTPARR